MEIDSAIRERFSTRAFTHEPVTRETISKVLDIARWAPSGANLQPWHVAVVQGEAKARITAGIIAARDAGIMEHAAYRYYPEQWFEPYKSRRVKTGMALYQAQGISRGDREKRKQAWYRNYHFFDAPVALLFFLDSGMGEGAWIDMGIFLQSVMLAAMQYDLATCPEASIADYPDIVKEELGLENEKILVCGMALGYPDKQQAVNQYRTERESIDEFTLWYD